MTRFPDQPAADVKRSNNQTGVGYNKWTLQPGVFVNIVLTFRQSLFAVMATFAVGAPYLSAQDNGAPRDFAHDVLPILRERCARCHTNGTYQGGVSMDTRQSLIESHVIQPGDADESELIARIESKDDDYRMPPEGQPLTAAEIKTLRDWIDGDATWEEGFTFKEINWKAPIQPRRPPLPSGAGQPSDRIIGAYFQQKAITWPDPSDDAAFARRLQLDVLGLLPEPDSLLKFLANPASDRRQQLVDRLLERNADYADHWMTFWNDLLRNDYAGTGYIDGGRQQITRWLHRSLYENKPYDQFVRELINPGEASQGFINGIKWRGNVNASQIREVQFAQNVSQVFLGENLKCASCHDSFINDWKLVDAYGMAAIVAEQPLEMFRCDKATGQFAEAKFLWPELGAIDPNSDKRQRLEQTARLITAPDNGRFARTIVNRIWHRMMGRGLVEPVDVMSNRPWSPDLLDYLATDLVDHGFDLKHTIRTIARSRIYQAQCATQTRPADEAFVFRGPLARRLTAEQFVDAVRLLTGTTPEKRVAEIDDYGETPARPVRAVLVHADPLMRSLGRPNREQVVSTRDDQLSTLQALDLGNGQVLYQALQIGAEHLPQKYPQTDALVEYVFRFALSRSPRPSEKIVIEQTLGDNPDQQKVADLLWMVVMLPEFQHVR